MIDKQAIAHMTQMLALITKYSKGAFPEIETEASSENRRRAWALTKMLSRFAEHAAESDFYFFLSDNVNSTDAERKRCYEIARQEDRGYIHELHKFQSRAAEYKSNPVVGKDRTDGDIVRELELLLQDERALQKMQVGFAESGAAKLTKKERERREASRVVIEENFKSVKQQLEATEKLALERRMVVSLNRYRTVIKSVPVRSTKQPSAATKAKNAAILKLVAKTTAHQAKPKTTLATKSA
jgi:hypothetical protein